MEEIYSKVDQGLTFTFDNTLITNKGSLAAKRIFDVILSFIGLVALSPIFLLMALLVKLTSEGRVFYGQERMGRGGLTFTCYKFRTMRSDADSLLEQLLDEHPELLDEWNQSRKLKNDPRINSVGKFLRKTSLDELPQLWNVLKGDLSLVGPRPVVQSELDRYYKTKAAKVLSLRPGITGLWQVSGRNNVNYDERVRLDEVYVDKRSLFLDLQILLKTIPAVVNGYGAY